MVGKTPRARKDERDRMAVIKDYCGCLPCLLMGWPDVHTSIEHVTDRGRRVGKGQDQHKWTIGLCEWHHFGRLPSGQSAHMAAIDRGPSLAYGRQPFEEHFGDERHVLVPTQDFMLQLFVADPWPEYHVPRAIAREVRQQWIRLNSGQ